ncbi:hypothetical protein F5B20DRAFT_573296 [Whalleya microplaca]|nr:hypothetical protein F5B20DRAFT_573296 [Whalleya microplaca]
MLYGLTSSLLLGAAVTPYNLNVTAVTADKGSSILECWQLDVPFSPSTYVGISGSATAYLGSLANITYTVVPPHYDGELHNAPFKQWVVFISGLAYLTLPDDETTGAYISGGGHGVIFAADTADVSLKGHLTQFPGVTETVLLQIPVKDGKIPAHSLLHSGPCNSYETTGLLEMVTGGSW